jgi:hypothetical protein
VIYSILKGRDSWINKKNLSSFVSFLFRKICFAFPKVLKYYIM